MDLLQQLNVTPAIQMNSRPEISLSSELTPQELVSLEKLYQQSHISDPCSHCACFGGVQFSRDRAWLADNSSLEGTRFALARRHGDLVGFSQFYTEPQHFPAFVGDIAERFSHLGKCAYMYLILVDPAVRKQGLGEILYHAAFDESRRNGCDTILAEIFVCPVPNSTSLRFHESLGFQYSGLTVTHPRQIGERQCDLTYTQLFRSL